MSVSILKGEAEITNSSMKQMVAYKPVLHSNCSKILSYGAALLYSERLFYNGESSLIVHMYGYIMKLLHARVHHLRNYIQPNLLEMQL